MLTQKVSLGFLNLSTSKKAPFGANVIQLLNANAALFPELPVATDVLARTNSALAQALRNAEDGGKQARGDLNTAIAAWNDAFQKDANYVSLVANGDAQTIIKSGYNATKGTKQRVAVPGTLKNFHAVAPKAAGIIDVSCDADTTSHGYITIATPETGVSVEQTGNQLAITIGDTTTYVLLSTKSKAQFENMPKGKQLYLSTLAFNASGAGPLTNGQEAIPQ
ncbi:MAG: hypothetical protein JO072_11880 [Parafilimonas sp.]|nr:hypothetical protein [Parafilimonas sp.]